MPKKFQNPSPKHQRNPKSQNSPESDNWSLPGIWNLEFGASIIIQPFIPGIPTAPAFTTHEPTQHLSHILLNLLRILARLQTFDRRIQLLWRRARRQDILHL